MNLLGQGNLHYNLEYMNVKTILRGHTHPILTRASHFCMKKPPHKFKKYGRAFEN